MWGTSDLVDRARNVCGNRFMAVCILRDWRTSHPPADRPLLVCIVGLVYLSAIRDSFFGAP